MKQKVGLIHGSYFTRNFGDLLLAELAANQIRSHGLEPVTPWLMEEVYHQVGFGGGRGLRSFLPGRPLVFGGGGYISNTGGMRRAMRWFLPALMSRSYFMPYTIVAPGSDDELSSSVSGCYRMFVNMASEVSVRDEETRSALRSAGVTREIPVTIDTAVMVSRAVIPEKNMEEARRIIPQKGVVLLNLPQLGDEALWGFVKNLQNLTRNSSFRRVWLFENEPFNITSLVSALEAHGMSGDTILHHKDMWTVAAIIGRCDAVVTTQLHVGIVAYALGVPPCSPSAHEKTKRFYRQISRSNWQVDIPKIGEGAGFIPVKVSDWLRSIIEGDDEYYKMDRDLLTQNKLRAEANLLQIDRYLQKYA